MVLKRVLLPPYLRYFGTIILFIYNLCFLKMYHEFCLLASYTWCKVTQSSTQFSLLVSHQTNFSHPLATLRACWSQNELWSDILLAHRYLEVMESNCTIYQQKPLSEFIDAIF